MGEAKVISEVSRSAPDQATLGINFDFSNQPAVDL